MTDRTKIDKYTDMFLKYMRSRAWLKKQDEDFQKNIVEKTTDLFDMEKYKKAKDWLDNQYTDFQKNIVEPLDDYWLDELEQEDRDTWMFENEGMVDNG